MQWNSPLVHNEIPQGTINSSRSSIGNWVSCLYNWLLFANAVNYSWLSQLIALCNLINPTWRYEQDLWHLMIGNWEWFFIEAGLSIVSAKTHATKFADEKLTIESLQMLDRSMLKELSVTLMGEALCILKQAKKATAQSTRIQALATKHFNLHIKMTPQQFRKFRIDWNVFTKITNMPSSQFNIHPYICADEAVQNAIINTHLNFFTTDPDKLLDMVEVLVNQRTYPIVYRFAFASMSQDEGEPIQSYLVRLRAIAIASHAPCVSMICPMYTLRPDHLRGSKWHTPGWSIGQSWNPQNPQTKCPPYWGILISIARPNFNSWYFWHNLCSAINIPQTKGHATGWQRGRSYQRLSQLRG